MNNNTSSLDGSIAGLSKMIGGAAALIAAPYIAQQYRGQVLSHFGTVVDFQVAYWGSWVCVGLLAGCCFYGISTLLHTVLARVVLKRLLP